MKKSRLVGAQSVQNVLRELGRISSLDAPIGRASRFALQPVLRAAKANTPHAKVKKALVIKKDSTAPKNRPVHAVGGDPKNPHRRILHLLEFGTAPNGPHPGIAAQPFLTPAYEAHSGEVLDRFKEKSLEEVEKLAVRLARKHAGKK